MKVVLIGYYGFRNIGDDLMLQNLLAVLGARPDLERIDVLCREAYYPPLPKTRFLSAAKSVLPRRMLAVARADYVIWGGGTCLYESDDNSGLYWLARLQQLTKLFRGRFCFAGIGIGHFHTRQLAAFAARILNHADHVSYREASSMAAAGNLPGYNRSAFSSGDLVFLDTTLFDSLRTRRTTGNRIGRISFSGLHKLDVSLAAHHGKQLDTILEELDAELHFLPAHTGSADDNAFHRQVAAAMTQTKRCRFRTWDTPQEYVAIMAGMDLHIGMRLHSIICADLLGVPNIAIEYAPKVRYYVEKSRMLAEIRVIPLGDPFSTQLLLKVAHSYNRPDQFIFEESETAKSAIEHIFSDLPYREGI